MKKRLLSLAVAICLVAAMIPVVAAAAPTLEEGETIGYYFYIHATTNDIPANGIISTYATEYNETNGRYWKYDAGKNITGGVVRNSTLKSSNLYGQTRKGQYLALDIYIPETGKYAVEYKYKRATGGRGDVYIIQPGTQLIPGTTKLENLSEVLDAGKIIASVDYSSTSQTESGTENLSDVELKAGNNVLLFVVTNYGEFAGGTGNANYYTFPSSLTLTLTEKTSAEDAELTNAFTPDETVDVTDSYIAPSVGGLTTDGAINPVANGDGTYKITAEETKNGAKFLYWAKGLTTQKKIISFSNVIENYVPEEDGRNLLIAVYEDEVSANTEYYNANGQLIPGANQETTVSMAGYGTSDGWDKYGDTDIYVARYALPEPQANINITVMGGTGAGTYAYGDTVTCTADSTENFKCWKKNGEIVSRSTTYTFKAWENCTVEAVNEESIYNGSTMKIILDDFAVDSDTGIMAEFIGFVGNVVEKGIMFTPAGQTEAKKIAMTKPGTQFSVIADEAGTYKGYAVVEEENGSYTLITDGLVTITDKE